MNDFIFDYNDFIAIFADFAEKFTQSQVEGKLAFVQLVYPGLFQQSSTDEFIPPEEIDLVKDLVYLALAHFLTIDANPDLNGGRGRVKSIKNRQDSIVYAVTDSNSIHDLELTIYGQLLAQKIDLLCKVGFAIEGCDLGILDDS